MPVVLHTLLYLGLYLSQSTQVQEGYLPPPIIKALPGSVVLSNKPVTILCDGPPEAEAYGIYKMEGPELRDRTESLVTGKNNTLYISEIKTDLSGLYCCSYSNGRNWSPVSEPLHLVMTGVYDKPSLSSLNGTVVASGNNVALRCFSKDKFEAFILMKEDELPTIQRKSSTPKNKKHQTIFHLGCVTSTQAGTYRCCGVFNDYPYVCSHPSDPLQLVVNAPHHNQTKDYQSALIGVSVAIISSSLIILPFILCHRKAKNNAAKRERQPQAAGPMNGQASEARDAEEVTYFQVDFNIPTQGTASTPSLLPRQTQTSEYATVALT